ncbi:ribonuclease H-like protein [Phlegmacium glaucopus]|nr:ribonuclease H-like protein [Phlegmacium glaucopus]
MIREFASKRLTSPSRAHLHADTKLSKGISSKRETHSKSLNNVLASLDALKLSFGEDDSEIEISGPFPLSLESKSSITVARTGLIEKLALQANNKPIHPFFRPRIQHASNSWSNGPRYLSSKVSSPPASLNAITTTSSAVSGKLEFNTLAISDSVPDMPDIQFKDNLDQFPVYSYKRHKPLPVVVYTQHEEEANDLIAGLKAGPVALDIEWRLYFVRPKGAASTTLLERRAAVVQIADSSGLILVIQIYSMSRFPIKLQSLIENHEIPKIGVNILNDGNKLFRDYGILAQNLLELGAFALLADPAGSQKRSTSKRKIISLAKLVQWYCGMQLEKGDERTGNWELKLDKQQIDYAANDVHSSMVVYQKLCSIAQLNGITFTDKSMFTSNVKWPMLGKDQNCYQTDQNIIPSHGQFIRAYQSWHHYKMSLDTMCAELSLKKKYGHQQEDINLKPGTVISYIIGALQANPSLPYSLPKLIELVQMDTGSWTRHRKWIIYAWNQI